MSGYTYAYETVVGNIAFECLTWRSYRYSAISNDYYLYIER